MKIQLIYLSVAGLLVTFYNNGCSKYELKSKVSASGACDPVLQEQFQKTYHPFLVTNCNGCHRQGGQGSGAFADENPGLAFEQFQLRGSQRVKANAVSSNHKPPATGPHHQVEIDRIEAEWQSALAEHAVCKGDSEPDDGGVTTIGKVMNAGPSPRTMQWDLGLETVEGKKFTGARLSVDVNTETVNENPTYHFSNLRLSAGGQAVHIRHLEIRINGEVILLATTYKGVDRRVPAFGTRDLALTKMVVPFDVQAGDTLAFDILQLEESDFAPPSFAQLISGVGVFGKHCLSCHNSGNRQGGIDLSTQSGIMSQQLVSAGNPEQSRLYRALTDEAEPMPPLGRLLDSDLNSVRDWILDGALP